MVRKIWIKKAIGPDGVHVEVWKILGSLRIGCLIKLFNKILVEWKILKVWKESCVVPIFKSKGDIQEGVGWLKCIFLMHDVSSLIPM